MSGDSNIDDVRAWLDELIGTFDFNVDIGLATLGENFRDLVASMIQKRSISLRKGADEH